MSSFTHKIDLGNKPTYQENLSTSEENVRPTRNVSKFARNLFSTQQVNLASSRPTSEINVHPLHFPEPNPYAIESNNSSPDKRQRKSDTSSSKSSMQFTSLFGTASSTLSPTNPIKSSGKTLKRQKLLNLFDDFECDKSVSTLSSKKNKKEVMAQETFGTEDFYQFSDSENENFNSNNENKKANKFTKNFCNSSSITTTSSSSIQKIKVGSSKDAVKYTADLDADDSNFYDYLLNSQNDFEDESSFTSCSSSNSQEMILPSTPSKKTKTESFQALFDSPCRNNTSLSLPPAPRLGKTEAPREDFQIGSSHIIHLAGLEYNCIFIGKGSYKNVFLFSQKQSDFLQNGIRNTELVVKRVNALRQHHNSLSKINEWNNLANKQREFCIARNLPIAQQYYYDYESTISIEDKIAFGCENDQVHWEKNPNICFAMLDQPVQFRLKQLREFIINACLHLEPLDCALDNFRYDLQNKVYLIDFREEIEDSFLCFLFSSLKNRFVFGNKNIFKFLIAPLKEASPEMFDFLSKKQDEL